MQRVRFRKKIGSLHRIRSTALHSKMEMQMQMQMEMEMQVEMEWNARRTPRQGGGRLAIAIEQRHWDAALRNQIMEQ